MMTIMMRITYGTSCDSEVQTWMHRDEHSLEQGIEIRQKILWFLLLCGVFHGPVGDYYDALFQSCCMLSALATAIAASPQRSVAGFWALCLPIGCSALRCP